MIDFKLAVQNEKLKCFLLEKLLATMRNEIKTKAVNLPPDFSSSFDKTMDNNKKFSPFIKLFWEQQKPVFSMKSAGKYHHMVKRFWQQSRGLPMTSLEIQMC